MRVPNIRILGLRFNDLAYLLTITVEIKYCSGTGKTIVKNTHISSLIQLIKSSSQHNVAFPSLREMVIFEK